MPPLLNSPISSPADIVPELVIVVIVPAGLCNAFLLSADIVPVLVKVVIVPDPFLSPKSRRDLIVPLLVMVDPGTLLYCNALSVELLTVDTVTPESIVVVVSSPLISKSVQFALMVVFASSAVISVQSAAKAWVVRNGVKNSRSNR